MPVRTSDRIFNLPEHFRLQAKSLGQAGLNFIAELPSRIAGIEHEWSIEVGQPFPNATEAFVAPASSLETREEVVVKIFLPGIDPSRRELQILRIAAGRGYATLVRAQEATNTLLLERLGETLDATGLPVDDQVRTICQTLEKAWLPVISGLTLPTGREKAIEMARSIQLNWESLGRPMSERALGTARRYAQRRIDSFDSAKLVLCHGDPHQWNALRVAGSDVEFKFVDPDGVYAEKAFDLAIPMREWGSTLPAGDLLEMGRRRCLLLAEVSGVGAQPIWEWAVLQCAWNGLELLRIGLTPPALVEFAMAEAFSSAGDL